MTNSQRHGYLFIIRNPGLRAEQYAEALDVDVKTVHRWFGELGMPLSAKPSDCVGGVTSNTPGPKPDPRCGPGHTPSYNMVMKSVRMWARNHGWVFRQAIGAPGWAMFKGRRRVSEIYGLRAWRDLLDQNNLEAALL